MVNDDRYWDDVTQEILSKPTVEDQIAALHDIGNSPMLFQSARASVMVRLQKTLVAFSQARHSEIEGEDYAEQAAV